MKKSDFRPVAGGEGRPPLTTRAPRFVASAQQRSGNGIFWMSATAVLALALVAVVVWRLSSSPNAVQKTASRPTTPTPHTPAEQILKQPSVVDRPSETKRLDVSVSPAPQPPTAPQVEPLRPIVQRVTLSEGDGGRSLLTLRCVVKLPATLARQQPPFICVHSRPELGNLVLDTDTINGDAYQTTPEHFNGWDDHGVGHDHGVGPDRIFWPLVIRLSGVPQAKTVVRLDGHIILLRQVGPGATETWNVPGDVGQSRQVGPANIKLWSSKSEVSRFPGEGEPRDPYWDSTFIVNAIDEKVQGSTLAMLNYSDDPAPPTLQDGVQIVQMKVCLTLCRPYSGSPPKALRLVIPELALERIPMRIENVEIPQNATIAADIPIGPRGPSEVQVDGFTVVLKSLTVSSKEMGKPFYPRERKGVDAPILTLKIDCWGPEKAGLVSFPLSLLDVKAVTEAGDQLIFDGGTEGGWTPTRYPSTNWNGGAARNEGAPAKIESYFRMKPADRFVSLTGRFYPLLFGEEWAEEVFEVPPGDERPKIKKGPFTLELNRQGDTLRVLISMPEWGLPGPEVGWWNAVTIACHDSSGQDFTKGVRRYQTFNVYEVPSPKGALTVSVKYPVKGTATSLPFEFKDVGLPRKESATPPVYNDF